MPKTTLTEPSDCTAKLAASVDPASLFRHAFASPEMVGSAAALLQPLPRWDGREGPRARIEIGPGLVRIARRDPARAERTHERVHSGDAHRVTASLAAQSILLEHHQAEADAAGLAAAASGDFELAADEGDRADWYQWRIDRRDAEPSRRARVTCWSAKSRARMVAKLASLDYAPLFDGGGIPAMTTLTYPGDWLSVVPDAQTAQRHVRAFCKRYERAWGVPLKGIWKREFQERGAPHFHIHSTPPRGTVDLDGVKVPYRDWLSRTWADIVAAEHCGAGQANVEAGRIVCCERHRHIASGTGVDYAEGMRAKDPKRLAIYFTKHGAYAAKEYQNHAPAEWIEAGSVGRFWGVWGLKEAVAVVEVDEKIALAAARTLRRWQEANGYRVQRTVFRVDTRTGVIRTRRSGVWSGARMRGSSGFVVVNDAPALISQMSRYLDQVDLTPTDLHETYARLFDQAEYNLARMR